MTSNILDPSVVIIETDLTIILTISEDYLLILHLLYS